LYPYPAFRRGTEVSLKLLRLVCVLLSDYGRRTIHVPEKGLAITPSPVLSKTEGERERQFRQLAVPFDTLFQRNTGTGQEGANEGSEIGVRG